MIDPCGERSLRGFFVVRKNNRMIAGRSFEGYEERNLTSPFLKYLF